MTTPSARIPLAHARRQLESLMPGEIAFTNNDRGSSEYAPAPLGYDLGSMELFAHKDAFLDAAMLKPRSIVGLAAIARFVSIPSHMSEATLSGLVVDLRRLSIPIDPTYYRRDAYPEDTEEQRRWDEAMATRMPVAAVASLDEMHQPEMSGDENAFSALQELMDAVDAMARHANEKLPAPQTPVERRSQPRRSLFAIIRGRSEEKRSSPEAS